MSRRKYLASAAALAATFGGLRFSEGASTAAQTEGLFPGESVAWGAGFPSLAMFRRGAPAKPLVLFLPGGGHLARIGYGHPGARPEDFLLTHLSRAGFSVLALSYPSGHPSLNHPVPEMTLTQWAASVAAVTAKYVADEQLPPCVIVVGWSLAGRLARNLSLDLRSRGICLEIFVGLSATPPIPGFGGLRKADLLLASSGLLDGSSARSSIFRSREAQLAVVDEINGRIVLPREVYAHLYVTDSPINFRGEAERFLDHGLVTDLEAAIADQGTFDFGNYPLCAVVTGTDPTDSRHALTDSSAWGMLNAQALYTQMIKSALARGKPSRWKWAQLRSLMDDLPARLSRRVEGSHFFFLGRSGAGATAEHVQDLVREAAAVRQALPALLA